MAGQIQVAHSKNIVGVGIVAGGPFGCAQSNAPSRLIPTAVQNFTQALEGCMSDKLRSRGIPNVPALVSRAKDLASQGEIEPLEAVTTDRVYLFSGGADQIVARSVVKAAQDFYLEVGVPEANIKMDSPDNAGHAFLTVDTGTPCGSSAKPFVSDCDYDQAGAILNWIYDGLAAPAEQISGTFIRFDQSPFGDRKSALSSTGIVYVPTSCSEQPGCRLHIALHGCEQNLDTVGMTFVEGSGFARWADSNRMVVLFPQVSASLVNPQGCWDWWGYTGSSYLTEQAPQIDAIWQMVERLASHDVAPKVSELDRRGIHLRRG
jgi:hypothetical protein